MKYKMTPDWLDRCLEDLERRIDPLVEDDLRRKWVEFSDGRFKGDIFVPRRLHAAPPPSLEWPKPSVNDEQRDPSTMLLSQLGACSGMITGTSGAVLGVRCNYGVGIMPSLFGAEIRLMDESQGNLPTSVPLGPDRCRALLDKGVPDLRTGLGAAVFDTAERYLDAFRRYPSVGRHVGLYHPDLQGPMDVVELLWGSDLFTAVCLEPQTVTALLELVTETYLAFMRRWNALVPPANAHAVHWRLLHKGRIMLRDDSAMNFAPEHFDQFIRPYDQRLLRELGGGAVHFCGRGDHYISRLCTMDGLHAVNLSQPELNNMETIFAHTVDRGIKVLDLRRDVAEQAVAAGRDLHGCVQCF